MRALALISLFMLGLAAPAHAYSPNADEQKTLTCIAELFLIGAAQDRPAMVEQSGALENKLYDRLGAKGVAAGDVEALVDEAMADVDYHLGGGADPKIPVDQCQKLAN